LSYSVCCDNHADTVCKYPGQRHWNTHQYNGYTFVRPQKAENDLNAAHIWKQLNFLKMN
jgi:hypothetical protein